jgi:hypothetical protein
VALGAIEVRVHVGRDFIDCQAALESARRVRPVLAEPGKTRNFRFVHMGGRAEDARTAAMLVQRTVAQSVELCSRPPAAQQAQGAKAIGDKGDQIDLDLSSQLLDPPPCAGCGFDRFRKFWQRYDVAVDETLGNEGAQERAGIVG